jgi:hypothetical protein
MFSVRTPSNARCFARAAQPIFESYQHLYNKHRPHATLSRERSSLKVTSSPQSRLFSIAQGPRTASAKEKATVTRGAAYAFPDGLPKERTWR